MNISDVEALKNWLSRIGVLDSVNKDLLDDAIWYLKNNYTARAELALKGAMANFRNAGKSEAEKAIARILN